MNQIKTKKGLLPLKMMLYIVMGFCTALMLLVVGALMSADKDVKIPPGSDISLSVSKALSSRCFAFQDPIDGSTYINSIDLSKFNDAQAKKCFNNLHGEYYSLVLYYREGLFDQKITSVQTPVVNKNLKLITLGSVKVDVYSKGKIINKGELIVIAGVKE